MTDSDFITVFDVAESGYRNWWFPAFGLIFIIIGVVLLTRFRAGAFATYQKKSIFNRSFPLLFLGFAILWTVSVFLVTFRSYWKGREALLSGHTPFIEGTVEDFVPMPYTGHAMESFDVKGVRFRYSDYVIRAGFNQTESHGGPVHAGTYVRIWYVGNDILKLQVRK